MPVERVDVFARIIAVTVVATVLWTDLWAWGHGSAPVQFYRPILVARLLHLPAPTTTTTAVLIVAVVAAAVWACTRRAPRPPSGCCWRPT